MRKKIYIYLKKKKNLFNHTGNLYLSVWKHSSNPNMQPRSHNNIIVIVIEQMDGGCHARRLECCEYNNV